MQLGLRLARKLLVDLARARAARRHRAARPITPQYLADLISWAAIGARTTESQTHREMASGLSIAGRLQEHDRREPAGRQSTRSSRRAVRTTFLGIDQRRSGLHHPHRGQPDGTSSCGRADAHYDAGGIPPLRGAAWSRPASRARPWSIAATRRRQGFTRQPRSAGPPGGADAGRQPLIMGFMLESNLEGGTRSIAGGRARAPLRGVVTDACVDWPPPADLTEAAAGWPERRCPLSAGVGRRTPRPRARLRVSCSVSTMEATPSWSMPRKVCDGAPTRAR